MGNTSCCTAEDDRKRDIDVKEIKKRKSKSKKGHLILETPTEQRIKDNLSESSDFDEYIPHNGDYSITNKMSDHIFEIYENFAPIKSKAPKDFDLKEKREFRISKDGTYEGYYKAGTDTKDGQGLIIYPDGSIYDGWWKDDVHHGKGLKILSTSDLYFGNFKNGIMHGEGEFIYHQSDLLAPKQLSKADGSKYKGTWKDNLRDGKGTQNWSDDSRYEGDWKKGKKDGHGIFIWPDKSQYEGEFKEDNFHGHGTYEWADGKTYEGEWKEGKMDGKGIYKWKDGVQKYEGDFKDDKRHGLGTFTWSNGKVYTGYWNNGVMHGEGTIVSPDGTRSNVTFENGKKVK